MKIAQVVTTYPPYPGGIGSVAHEYTERLRQRQHHVHVFTPLYEKKENDPKYVHRIFSPFHTGNAGVVPSLAIRLKGFDLVHLHYPFFGGAEPVLIRKFILKHQPLVITYHHDVVGMGIKGLIFDLHRRMLFPWIMNRADCILVSSRAYADTCSLQQLSQTIQKKIHIFPFGVDIKRFFPGKDISIKEKLGIHETIPLILFVGGLDKPHYFKGLPILFEALANIKEISWQTAIIGDGELRPFYESLVEKYGIKGRVIFLGAVGEEEKPAYMRNADIHVFPSIDRTEAFGLVALEAASSGLPTIASNLPGVNFVVQHPKTGLLVPPENSKELQQALVRLLQDKALRETMGQAARKRVEECFSWDGCIDKLEGLYTSLVQKKQKIL